MSTSRTHQTGKVAAVRAMQPPARLRRARLMAGVTLIEAVITLSIAAILMTVAVPSFQDLMRNNRATALANEFLVTLNLARSEAVKRGTRISVCSSTDSATCRTSSATNWADGWILYVDGTSPEEVLHVWPALNGTATFTASDGQVTFLGTGQAVAAITFTYTPTGCTGEQQRTVSVNIVGRAAANKASCP